MCRGNIEIINHALNKQPATDDQLPNSNTDDNDIKRFIFKFQEIKM